MSDGMLWRRAAAFAERAHAGQFRRDGRTPYAAHAGRVAMTVALTFGCADEQAIAIAWLHDTVEDTTTDYEDLLEGFGPAVADGVSALTKHAALPEAQREAAYDQRLAEADWRPKLVKLADVMDNLLDSGPDAEPGPDSAARRARVADRAERAIAIARADASERPEVTRAISIVSDLLAEFRAGPRA